MISIVNLHIFTLFILIIIFANNHPILANSINHKNAYLPQSLLFDYDQSKNLFVRDTLSHELIDDETPSSDLWSIIFRPNYIPPVPGISLRRGENHANGFKKRKIPLELQKALYAHGIVGRRR